MKKLFPFIILTVFAISIVSCDEKDHKTSHFNKDGTVEVVFETSHLNETFDILTTTKNIYKAGQIVRTVVNTDTLPALGAGMVEGENIAGETKDFNVKKDYSLFVTIK